MTGEDPILNKLTEIRDDFNGYAKYIFGFSFRNFQESKIKDLSEAEKDILLYELIEEKNQKTEEWKNSKKRDDGINHNTVRLWTEGSTDKTHIENAWNGLYPGRDMPFEIINGYCVGNLKELGSRGKLNMDEIMILCFDFDYEGAIEGWNGFKDWVVIENQPEKCLTRKSIDENKYALLLPTFREIGDQVISEDKFLNSKNFQFKNACFDGKPQHMIELMFLGIVKGNDSHKWNSLHFYEERTYYGGKYWWLKKDKVGFDGILQSNAVKFKLTTKELYINFIPIFDKILTIIATK